MQEIIMYDTIIIGGGTAGLSAALVLGRARRRVLLVSDGPPRNAPADAAHGFFTRDGTPPMELLRVGRAQLAPYSSVEFREVAATRIVRDEYGFTVTFAGGQQERSRTIALATGVRDELPAIPGFAKLWGNGIYHCPYCHGWEVRDTRLGIYARGEIAMHLAPLVRNWSPAITLLSDGPDDLTPEQRTTLQRLEIELIDTPISHLEIAADRLTGVAFTNGNIVPLDGIFAAMKTLPNNDLARQLGCELVADGLLAGHVQVDQRGQTTIPGVYAAGDLTTAPQQLAVAASSGAMLGAQINFALVEEVVRSVTPG
jgi:thioredoxin reductase